MTKKIVNNHHKNCVSSVFGITFIKHHPQIQHVVVQWPSHVWLFATPWTAACWASLSFTISRSLLKLTSIESVMPSNHFILRHVPFSCLQSFPASGSFLMSWLFTSSSQSIGASTSASVLLTNIQDWFPLGLTGLISLQSKGLSRSFLILFYLSLNSYDIKITISKWAVPQHCSSMHS